VRTELARSVALGVVFLAGLGAGIWVFVSPWAVGYPMAGAGWTPSVWSSVAAGALVAATSGACLVAVLARGLGRAVR
jgi:hypothetical protein